MDAWEQPELVVRGSRNRVEGERDREVLEWIARFRFVTVEVLSERFGVSVRRVNSRVSALETAGLVRCVRGRGSQRRAVFVSRRGAVVLGLAPRRPPRPEVQREHELAIGRMVARIERERPSVRVLTEREGRRLEGTGGTRCSVDVFGPGGRRQCRWPDLIVEAERQRVAIELELAAKTTERLRQIVAAYASSRAFSEARFLVGSAPLAARIESLCAAERRPAGSPLAGAVQLAVAPWPGAPAAERARIESALVQSRLGGAC